MQYALEHSIVTCYFNNQPTIIRSILPFTIMNISFWHWICNATFHFDKQYTNYIFSINTPFWYAACFCATFVYNVLCNVLNYKRALVYNADQLLLLLERSPNCHWMCVKWKYRNVLEAKVCEAFKLLVHVILIIIVWLIELDWQVRQYKFM